MERRSSDNDPGQRTKSRFSSKKRAVPRTHPVVVRASFVRLPRPVTLQPPAPPPSG